MFFSTVAHYRQLKKSETCRNYNITTDAVNKLRKRKETKIYNEKYKTLIVRNPQKKFMRSAMSQVKT